jgi:uncharacterized DUF497 family protein
MALVFEWHETKARENRRRHGVSFDEAKTVFADGGALVIPDPAHSVVEDRWLRLGISSLGRVLVVVYTERDGSIRLISARKASRPEQTTYEEANRR